MDMKWPRDGSVYSRGREPTAAAVTSGISGSSPHGHLSLPGALGAKVPRTDSDLASKEEVEVGAGPQPEETRGRVQARQSKISGLRTQFQLGLKNTVHFIFGEFETLEANHAVQDKAAV